MWKVFLLFAVCHCLADDVTDGTTLVQTFLVHRHGDRTPFQNQLDLTTDPDRVFRASAEYGYGQLTNLGKQRSYRLGQYIRKRYDELLPAQYNRSEFYLRSTDRTRTKMTALVAMAATFPPPKDNWSKQIAWTPVPYTTEPLNYDPNNAPNNCPIIVKHKNAIMETYPPRMKEYSDELEVLAEVTGRENVTSYPLQVFIIYDVLESQKNLGVPLGKKIEDIMARLKEASDLAASYIFDLTLSKYTAGVLLNEFITESSNLINGRDTARTRIYSLHDSNVYAFMLLSRIPNQGGPPFAASFALELRRVDATGQYVVLPVYKSDPCEDSKYLQVEGCDQLCDLEQFHKLVADTLLDEDTWRADCNKIT